MKGAYQLSSALTELLSSHAAAMNKTANGAVVQLLVTATLLYSQVHIKLDEHELYVTTTMPALLSWACCIRGDALNMAKHAPSTGSVPMGPAGKADAPPTSLGPPSYHQPKREVTDEDDDAVQSGRH